MAKIWTEEKLEILKTYLKNGLKIQKIANKMNTTYEAVSNASRRYNLSGYRMVSPVIKKFENNIDLEELDNKNFTESKDNAKLKWNIRKGTKINKKKHPYKIALLMGDHHIPHQNDASIKAILELMDDIKFDYNVIGGDFLDYGCISHWNKNKHRKLELTRLKNDYILGNSLLDEFDKRLPKDCKKYYLFGNHEVWADNLLEEMPQLEGLIEPESQLFLDERKYKKIPYNDILNIGKLNITHGIYATTNSVKKHLDELKVNILFFHTHTIAMMLSSSPARQIAFAGYNVGCLCYDKETEVLTDQGWKYFKDLNESDLILGYNPITKQSQYEKPKHYQCYKYSGFLSHYTSDRVDLLVTPEHKMLYKTSGGNNRVVSSSELFNKKKNYGTYVGSIFNGERRYTEDEMRLVGWIISEGSIDNKHMFSPRISIYQKKEPQKSDIRSLLIRLNLTFNESVDFRNGVSQFRINTKDTKKVLKLFPNKIRRISRDILNSDNSLLKILLDTLMAGDGTKTKSDTRIYATNSPKLAQDVSEIMHKIGNGAIIYKQKRNTNFKKNAVIYLVSEHRSDYTVYNKKTLERYDGMVYDVTMPSGWLYVRRNNKITISGNCNLSPDYMNGRPHAWQHGFAVGYFFPDGSFDIQLIRILNGKFIFNNKIYDGNK